MLFPLAPLVKIIRHHYHSKYCYVSLLNYHFIACLLVNKIFCCLYVTLTIILNGIGYISHLKKTSLIIN